jgi:hypothetical protein
LITCPFFYRYVEEGQFSNSAQGSDLAKLYSKNPGAIPVDDFNQGDRERVLELLLSQERVVSLIYAKTFPVTNAATSTLAGSPSQNQDLDFSHLLEGNPNDIPMSARDISPNGEGRPVSSNGNIRASALPPITQRGVSR